MVTVMQAKSRGLCSDQLAWFRNDAHFHWLDATQDTDTLAAELLTCIQAEHHQGVSLVSSLTPPPLCALLRLTGQREWGGPIIGVQLFCVRASGSKKLLLNKMVCLSCSFQSEGGGY